MLEKDEIVLYTVQDIEKIFRIGRTKAYELIKADGFPSIRLNSRFYVPKNKLDAWIERQNGKEFRF